MRARVLNQAKPTNTTIQTIQQFKGSIWQIRYMEHILRVFLRW